jgi:hypothetical protein
MRIGIKEQEIEGRIFSVGIPIKQGHLERKLHIPANVAGIVLSAHGSGSSRQRGKTTARKFTVPNANGRMWQKSLTRSLLRHSARPDRT